MGKEKRREERREEKLMVCKINENKVKYIHK